MGISDVIFDNIYFVIDDFMNYYEDKPLEILKNEDVIEYIACALRISSRGFITSFDEENKKKNEERDFKYEAYALLKDVLYEEYISSDEN